MRARGPLRLLPAPRRARGEGDARAVPPVAVTWIHAGPVRARARAARPARAVPAALARGPRRPRVVIVEGFSLRPRAETLEWIHSNLLLRMRGSGLLWIRKRARGKAKL